MSSAVGTVGGQVGLCWCFRSWLEAGSPTPAMQSDPLIAQRLTAAALPLIIHNAGMCITSGQWARRRQRCWRRAAAAWQARQQVSRLFCLGWKERSALLAVI